MACFWFFRSVFASTFFMFFQFTNFKENQMDLICFSHLRWHFVFQRPQHLMIRFSKFKRVYFIEEPILNWTVNEYKIVKDSDHPNVHIIVPHISADVSIPERNSILKELLNTLIKNEKIENYISWYYSPLALLWSRHLSPQVVIYDCMDELSAFKFAPVELKDTERELMKLADIVFTGGRSLFEAKKWLHQNIFCFPSSIDKTHFEQARTINTDPEDQHLIPHPRLGFFGVIDERLDIDLIDKISNLKPDWQIVLVGPVVKIDPATLPQKRNIHYLGGKQYKDLPAYLAGWDIALLPFAKNESTQFISPTKTPEYLAGGKPVISTSITDVVNPYGKEDLVKIADTAEEFVLAVEEFLNTDDPEKRIQKADLFLANISWDQTFIEMSNIIEEKLLENTSSLTPKKDTICLIT